MSTALQPHVNTSQIVDEWKLLQVDTELPKYEKKEKIDKYWNDVFNLDGLDGEPKYKLLPYAIKSALCLGQTNADSERSLSINARVLSKERASMGERTLVGLRVVKDA